MRRLLTALAGVSLCATMAWTPGGTPQAFAAGHPGPGRDVLPSLVPNLVDYYDFEHPVPGDPARERDRGSGGTAIELVNGGADMRVHDGAYPASSTSIQVKQVNPTARGNDDWKAGVYSASGVPTMHAFNHVHQVTVMGWVKMTGANPAPNTDSDTPGDYYNAVGLVGVLTGDSDGHAVRALLEIIDVNGTLRLVALGRRVDGSSSQTFAANEDWHTLLPLGTWVFLAATFDYGTGKMALYRDGRPLAGFYTLPGDPWGVQTGDGRSSATDPRGIKIGGSFPQDRKSVV